MLGECAVIYRALARSMTPAEVDQLELWQIAVLLGFDEMPGLQGPAVPTKPLPPQPDKGDGIASGPRLVRVY